MGPTAFDVLGNDDDGNCDSLTLGSHDTASLRGGIVTLSEGTGPAGRDELVYDGPALPFVGTDSFNYDVSDGGLTTPGQVEIIVDALTLEGYWPLDDGSGATAADASVSAKHGTLVGDPQWSSGQHEGALVFDGDDSVIIPGLNLARNTVTMTTWLRRDGSQSPFSAMLFSRDGTTSTGFHFGNSNELRYTWNGISSTYNWNSGLFVPDGTWVFAALVVEPNQATIHLYDGVLNSSSQAVTHDIEAFDGILHVGLDTNSAARHFVGALDDIRIYGYALSSSEIVDLVELRGRTEAPRPPDGGFAAHAFAPLTWLPGFGANTHAVYFGTDYNAVATATTADAPYQGASLSAQYTPIGLVPDTTYYWRVDENGTGHTSPGHVWQFELAGQHRWPMDETSGVTANELVSELDGTFVGAPLLNQPGPTVGLDRAVRFDGFNDYVELPAIHLHANSATMTAWVRRVGNQTPFSGIVFTRAGGSVAGLHIGNANELRYSWNDAGNTWGWDSGLVTPDNTWVFTALVVEPDQATLYLGNGGILTATANGVSHGDEEFDGVANIGRDPNSGRYFDGWIDDVRFYRAALSSAEIQALYDRAFCTEVTFGDVNSDGSVDLADILCVADGFAGIFTCPLASTDLAPCGGDGELTIDDLLATIDSFAGQPRCADECVE
jgi:hypothetical protein